MEKWFSVEKWRDDQHIVDYDGANVKDMWQKILQKYVEALDSAQWASISEPSGTQNDIERTKRRSALLPLS